MSCLTLTLFIFSTAPPPPPPPPATHTPLLIFALSSLHHLISAHPSPPKHSKNHNFNSLHRLRPHSEPLGALSGQDWTLIGRGGHCPESRPRQSRVICLRASVERALQVCLLILSADQIARFPPLAQGWSALVSPVNCRVSTGLANLCILGQC